MLGGNAMENMPAKGERALAALAYFALLAPIPLAAGKKRAFARYHAREGLKLLMCELAALALCWLHPAFGCLGLALSGLAAYGCRLALEGRQKPLPLVGRIPLGWMKGSALSLLRRLLDFWKR
jgi:hypothetical protein